MTAEISGDGRMSIVQRFHYLMLNLGRNLLLKKCDTKRLRFCARRLPRTPLTASPGRALTEAFILRQLPTMLTHRSLRVLEIGCGSGSLTRLLAESGYSGRYVGVDIMDRFDRAVQPNFQRDFVLADAHDFETDDRFDLVISISALEHVPEDRRLIDRLGRFVAPAGLQVHFVPSGWGLLTNLWHGYRQYTTVSLEERFGSQRTCIYAMGGVSSFMLHFLIITVGEMLLRLRLRQRLPRMYGWMLDRCLSFDRLVPFCGTNQVVCQFSVRDEEQKS